MDRPDHPPPPPPRGCGNCVRRDECAERLASWYPLRGQGPCPHWAMAPLTDADYD